RTVSLNALARPATVGERAGQSVERAIVRRRALAARGQSIQCDAVDDAVGAAGVTTVNGGGVTVFAADAATRIALQSRNRDIKHRAGAQNRRAKSQTQDYE